MSEQAMRFNEGKIDPTFVPVEISMGLADLWQTGAVKYARDNWRKGFSDKNRAISSLMRHTDKARIGEDFDVETGCRHWIQVAWNAGVLAMQDMYHDAGRSHMLGQLTYDEITRHLIDHEARATFLKEFGK